MRGFFSLVIRRLQSKTVPEEEWLLIGERESVGIAYCQELSTAAPAVHCQVNIKVERTFLTSLSQQDKSRFPFKNRQGGLLIGLIPEDSLTLKKQGGHNRRSQHVAENGHQPRGSYRSNQCRRVESLRPGRFLTTWRQRRRNPMPCHPPAWRGQRSWKPESGDTGFGYGRDKPQTHDL